MKTLPWSYRTHHAMGVVACLGLMAYALYAQHVLHLDPCPLCMFQRVAVVTTGLGFALAWALGSKGRRKAWAWLLPAVPAALGIGVAGRHVWLQSLPPDQVPACGPGLDFMLDAFPLKDVIARVLTGSGQCATIDWSLLGLSMPAWVLIACGGLLAWALAGTKAR